TFAVRRMNIFDSKQPNFLEKIDLNKYKFLPNTAGAKTAEEAVRIAKLADASGMCHMIKVEIIGCDKTLLPDPVETLTDSVMFIERCFTVLIYTTYDVVIAQLLDDLRVDAVMQGASAIDSGQRIIIPLNLSLIIVHTTIPVIDNVGIR